jgi:tRNA-splicing ligase RtcB
MVSLNDLVRISDFEWEIPLTFRKDMRVPVRLFATRKILEKVMEDKSLEQAVNAATLPGLVGHVIVMPDMHQGYGFPIGGVAATRFPDGVISPGAIGYDINCGVRLLASPIPYDLVQDEIDNLANALNQYCPSGVGEHGAIRLSEAELNQVCVEGSRWTLKKGYATDMDVRRTEEGGRLEGADPTVISKRALERGRPQLGTLGAGNHFIEIDIVDQVFDPKAASVMGLS